jgi:hypothetical protein
MTDDESLATLDFPSQISPQEPRQDGGGTPGGSRSAKASTDNLRLLRRDADLIAQLRADVRRQAADLRRQTSALAKAERRAERAEAKLREPKKKRPKKPPCETPEYAVFVEKSMATWGLRVADGDPSDLTRLRDFRRLHDDAVRVGARGLHATGVSWTEIAAAVGITRQGALKQWGNSTSTTERDGQIGVT